jgi:outer membrane protein OmpA-like peptidoglycan-associated protein
VQNHLQHTAGFIYWFKPGYRPKTKAQELAEVLPPPDADNDGVTDSLDRCPSIAGPPRFAGCPDSDNDGVPDSRDECPLVAGDSSMNGCPDSDGDGINDKVDQCPYVAGTAERNGCPVPDKDGDGFNDNEDRCPDVYSKTNGGCPEIRREIIQQVERAAKAIFFETGKATIRKVSFKPLDQVVAVLRSNPELYADIEGHTDDVGDDASNMDLSQRRAQAVMDYFTSKGIAADRLTAKGYGETQPIATNETATGKAQNRRTEINLRNYRQ